MVELRVYAFLYNLKNVSNKERNLYEVAVYNRQRENILKWMEEELKGIGGSSVVR